MRLQVLSDLIVRHSPNLWIPESTHDCARYQIGSTHVIAELEGISPRTGHWNVR